MLTLNKKLGKFNVGADDPPDELILEASNDSDRIMSDQIQSTLELISKIIDANV